MNDKIKETNAVIESVSLTIERGGILTAYLHLNYGENGGCQGFGGYSLYLSDTFTHHEGMVNYAGHFLFRCMQICEVEDWTKLKGKTVRARYEMSKVHEIGHIIKDDWFNPQKEFELLED